MCLPKAYNKDCLNVLNSEPIKVWHYVYSLYQFIFKKNLYSMYPGDVVFEITFSAEFLPHSPHLKFFYHILDIQSFSLYCALSCAGKVLLTIKPFTTLITGEASDYQ